MTPSVQTIAGLLMLSTVSCFSVTNTLNQPIHEGDAFSFNCCEKASNPIKAYVIYPPDGDTHPVFEGAVYASGRISASISNKCEVKVTKSSVEDNGIWKCQLFVHDEVHDSTNVIGRRISITVTVPPNKENQYAVEVSLASIGVILCFVLISVFCWRKKYRIAPCNWRNLLNDMCNTGNDDNNTTRVLNQNANSPRSEYVEVEELKGSIKKREMALGTGDVEDTKNTKKHSQDYTEEAKLSDQLNAKGKEKKAEDVNDAKETKLGFNAQSTPSI